MSVFLKSRTDSLIVDLQITLHNDSNMQELPTGDELRMWIESAIQHADFPHVDKEIQLSISFVDSDTIREMNFHYRQKNKPTNVLSFPMDTPAELPFCFLGDLVICPQVLATEATQNQKTFTAHFAHITVHGTLHLLGFDHETELDACVMEPLETKILTSLGFPDPYGVNTTS